MNKRRHASQGFSLIEVVIVLVVVAILATFAILALGSSAENLERQNIAKEFKVALDRARFDSIKRRPATCENEARVEILSPTRFAVITDQDQNGELDLDSETRTVDFQARGTTNITSPDLSSTVIFRFDSRGHVTSGPCSAPTEVVDTVTFCQMPCVAADSSNSSLVFISPAGTAAVLTGGSTIPDFSDPTVTSPDANVAPNPLLAIWDLIVGNTNTNTNTNAPVNININTNVNVNVNTNTTTNTNVNTNTSTNTTNTNTTNTNTTNTNTTNTNTTNTNTTNTNTNTNSVRYCELGQRPGQDGCDRCRPEHFLLGGKCRQTR